MDQRIYLNFDLSIDQIGNRYRARVLQSAAGLGSAEFELPFSELELENFILKMGHTRRGGQRKIRGSDSVEMAAAKEIGGRLFTAVFKGEVYACLHATISEAQTHAQGVRVLLRLGQGLTDLPWEYLYNASWNQFFSLSADTPLVRYLELNPPITPLPITLPLRMLVMISSPTDFPSLDTNREWQNLTSALRPLQERGVLSLELLASADLLTLQRKLRLGNYHIFHFIGHGTFDEINQDGLLLFCDESGRGKPLSGQNLGTILHDHHALRLAVLNACEGARSSREDPFAGAAHSLVQMGLPAVIAMQFEISDAAAILFAQEFYTALVDGYPVDAALADARKAIYASGGEVEWGTPVLFTRTFDGRIFDIAATGLKATQDHRLEQTEIKQSWDRRKQTDPTAVKRLYEDGLSAYYMEDWALALERFNAVLALQPDHVQAVEKTASAALQVDLAERYRQALQRLEAQQLVEAQQILEKLSADAPGYKDVENRLADVQKKIRLAELYADAQRLSQAGQPLAVINIFGQIKKIDSQAPDPEGLLAAAQKALAEQKKLENLQDLYTQALQAFEQKNWSEAQRLLLQVQSSQADYRDVQGLLVRVGRELEPPSGEVEIPEINNGQARRRLSVPVWGVLLGGAIVLILLIWVLVKSMLPLFGPRSAVTVTASSAGAVIKTLDALTAAAPTATEALPTATSQVEPSVTPVPPTPSPQPASGKLSLENIAGMTQLKRFGDGVYNQAVYSPDGSQIAVASSLGVYILAADTLKEIRFIDEDIYFYCIAFSPDGKTLAGGAVDNTIHIWRVSDGKLLQTFSGHTNGVRSVAFSPDGSTLASGSYDYTVRLWRVADGSPLQTLTGHTLSVRSVVFSPDGKTLASASADKSIRLWRVSDGSFLQTLEGHTGSVNSVLFSSDGKSLASASYDKTLRLWQVSDGKLIQTFEGHTGLVYSMAFSPDGRTLASGATDNTIKLWQAASGKLQQTIKTDGAVVSLDFTRDGKTLASVSRDGALSLWQVSTGILTNSKFGGAWINSLALSPDGQTIAAATDYTRIALLKTSDGSYINYLAGQTLYWENNVVFSADGSMAAACSGDYTIQLWNVQDARLLQAIPNGCDQNMIDISPNGLVLAAGYDQSINLWSTVTGKQIGSFAGHTSSINVVRFSPDGKMLASGSWDETLRLWQVTSGLNLIKTIEGQSTEVTTLAFSGDGSLLVSADSSKIYFWRVSDGSVLFSKDGSGNETAPTTTNCLAFSVDGKIVASGGSDGIIRLWSAADGTLLGELKGHTTSISSLAFTPDGKSLISGSGDGTIRTWGLGK